MIAILIVFVACLAMVLSGGGVIWLLVKFARYNDGKGFIGGPSRGQRW